MKTINCEECIHNEVCKLKSLYAKEAKKVAGVELDSNFSISVECNHYSKDYKCSATISGSQLIYNNEGNKLGWGYNTIPTTTCDTSLTSEVEIGE